MVHYATKDLRRRLARPVKAYNIYIYIYMYVTLLHLRSKGKTSAYKSYCTGSGMLTRYTYRYQCVYLINSSVNEIYALISVCISR